MPPQASDMQSEALCSPGQSVGPLAASCCRSASRSDLLAAKRLPRRTPRILDRAADGDTGPLRALRGAISRRRLSRRGPGRMGLPQRRLARRNAKATAGVQATNSTSSMTTSAWTGSHTFGRVRSPRTSGMSQPGGRHRFRRLPAQQGRHSRHRPFRRLEDRPCHRAPSGGSMAAAGLLQRERLQTCRQRHSTPIAETPRPREAGLLETGLRRSQPSTPNQASASG